MAAKATSSIQVLARVNRLLDTIAAHDEPISLKTLSSATGLHPSTAFRILASLIEHGFVERSESGSYRLGVKLLQLGNRVHGRLDMRREARPLMERLRDQTGETVNLCIREGDDVVYVERAVAPRLMRVEQVIGGRAPLHVTAAGKLFLAESGTAACREYAIRTGLLPRTAQSISDPEALCQALEAIRIAGYALDEQEAETGVSCIGAPVYDASNRLVAGLSLSAPAERYQALWIPWILHAAAAISSRLGYCGALNPISPPPAALNRAHSAYPANG